MRPLATTNRRLSLFVALLAIAFAIFDSTIDGTATRAADGLGGAKPSTANGAVEPVFKISRETTHVLGPLAPDGFIDYAAAINARYGRGVAPTDNLTVDLWQIFGPMPPHYNDDSAFFKALGIDPPPESGDYYIDLIRYLDEVAQGDDEVRKRTYAQYDAAMVVSWSAEEFPLIADWLKRNEPHLDRLVATTKKPHNYRPVATDSNERGNRDFVVGSTARSFESAMCREASKALLCRGFMHLKQGNLEAARNDSLALRRLARLISRVPTLVDFLIATSIEHFAEELDRGILIERQPDAIVCRKHYLELTKLPPLTSPAECLDSVERWVLLDSARLLKQGDTKLVNIYFDADDAPPTSIGLARLARTDFHRTLRELNRWTDRLIAACRTTDLKARRAEFAKLQLEYETFKIALDARGMPGENPVDLLNDDELGSLLRGLLEAWPIESALKNFDQTQQRFDIKKLGFALGSYRAIHGRYPETLDQLQPDFVKPDLFKTLSLDRFSGLPLRYGRLDKGYYLYSVGPNGRDDEGANSEHRDAGNVTEKTTDDLRLLITGEAK